MLIVRQATAALICAIWLSGCAESVVNRASVSGSIASVVKAADHGLEVSATPEEQARQEVLSTPTVFHVPFADDPYSWERARFFLENYLGGGAGHASAVTKVVGDRWSLASNPAIERYSYEVAKDVGEGGFTYQVSCIAKVSADAGQAGLNAGNLARFIREGKLELSLFGG
jgi:hypothetical protein